MKNEELVEESWDKKKIAIAAILLFCLVGFVYAAKNYFLESFEQTRKTSPKSPGSVAGASAEENKDSSSDSKDDSKPFSFTFNSSSIRSEAQKKLDSLKEQVGNLSVEDVASSSPQLQRVINDIKALEQYPKNQAKQMCENICKSLE
ncbi:MAG: hypothetical protein HYV37_01605 [Candidatus Levyibacteriota bacterium]|nr:MAG: hypothetical protein HYV37_01605 [Candidatus Levybacteria bacterium]